MYDDQISQILMKNAILWRWGRGEELTKLFINKIIQILISETL